METKLITLEVSMKAPPSHLGLAASDSGMLRSHELRSHIESQLAAYGTPLRWSITRIDSDAGSQGKIAHVEAVVTQAAS